MPQDTLWLNNERDNFIIYDHNNIDDSSLIKDILRSKTQSSATYYYSTSPHNDQHKDSLLQSLMTFERMHKENKFSEDEAYYDRLGHKLEFLIILSFIALIFYAIYRKNKKKSNPYAEDDSDWVEIGSGSNNFTDEGYEQTVNKPDYNFLIYKGKDLNFSSEEIAQILNNRFPYFKRLSPPEKFRFVQRHMKFMSRKDFRIHDKKGFKEMPVLISATAVQLSFGLQEYMLPYYKNINIFPEEFLGIEPHIRFLEGNVSGNAVNISWKHYLEGYEDIENGENVGLHEMAHAYYCQNMVCVNDRDHEFVKAYSNFELLSNTVLQKELLLTQRLYSDYGLRNLQEFWAESVEIFFEKSAAMKQQYPDLYTAMSMLLNQQPV